MGQSSDQRLGLFVYAFIAHIEIIGINPFVFVPENILERIFTEAGKRKGPIPVHGEINQKPFKQTLVRFKGHWRLYINTSMLKNSPKRIGEKVELCLAFEASDRSIVPHPKFEDALKSSPEAAKVFNELPLSRQKEMIRYISLLKTTESVDRNVKKAIDFLLGKARFIGRDKP
ncbi:YdeI/OmpD-associated family protein [Marinilongibacter aquaticus]|uniref:YdeI/OmpD-associated family protein n=1 Tax=Marinilongibacter aquaticus TaxID=2975157 RepID=UPI0021BD835C|nr:YdeI/OmpD-associated family protein [Marinilongibacter aquaticus]UBM57486.1 YdeI/OmpD-associated family protein [Marinilongibacter aquaticus]